ncbi:glycine C-acetyltransferase [Bordetella genomosp. 9]|uniref:2-amino-3-ketobutyrate coenzyme A ligase n=1 Tax=Bordetella genomosp. 9 TaxID=1416803 RepID=A0A261R7K0_9BORD|nr:glycine C-acetyltransferase [Bordetella genomosp. 9]OZI20986.1 glycine C-acetyltransferase [Bordetella genomosp. 9]
MDSGNSFYVRLRDELRALHANGLYKEERVIATAQGAAVATRDGRTVINLCANNYLGLSSHPAVIRAAQAGLDARGYGLSSVRFICGTQDIHKELEARLSRFLGTEDTILYAAAFDANGGLFEPLFGPEDAIISDELNHASIIDGIRLCKAKRYRYAHNSMHDLRACLQTAREERARNIIVFTDGVFSMDGAIAKLDEIRKLCDEFDALLGVDDCHATGFMGKLGRGTHEYRNVFGKVDIITGTLGKALGGASGGFTSGRKEVIDILRQRSRPYLFSNTVAPAIVQGTLAALDLLEADTVLRDRLEDNTRFFRAAISECGFDIKEGSHPIVPIMVHDANKAQALSRRLLELGVYAIGFFYPVVPRGQARIRVQVSAAHGREQLTSAVAAFQQAGQELGIVR